MIILLQDAQVPVHLPFNISAMCACWVTALMIVVFSDAQHKRKNQEEADVVLVFESPLY